MESPMNAKSVTKKAASTAHEAVDSFAGAAHQAVDKAVDAAAPTANWLTEKGESLTAAKKKLLGGTSGFVSENPLTSVAAAVVAGLLLSRLFR